MYQLARNIDICHMDTNEILDRIYPLPEASKEAVINCIEHVTFSKGHLLFKAGKIESNIYFLKKGIVRAYSDVGDNEVTFWFGKEGDTVISMKNYVAGEKGYENIELLEDGEFYKIKTSDLQKLFLEDIHIGSFFSILI